MTPFPLLLFLPSQSSDSLRRAQGASFVRAAAADSDFQHNLAWSVPLNTLYRRSLSGAPMMVLAVRRELRGGVATAPRFNRAVELFKTRARD
jgi:hypothetical protein